MAMGRRRSTHFDLPPHMARKGDVYYYVTTTKPRKWIKLGKDLALARRKWAELECAGPGDDATFEAVAKAYFKAEVPKKAPRTQKQNEGELKNLLPVFGLVPLDQIRPSDCRQYLDMREAKIRANREMALFSHIFNWARERGYTDAANPAYGVKRNKEDGRDVYVEDNEYRAVYEHADRAVRDAMDLAYLTGQRVSDVLKTTRASVRDGTIAVRQGKTGKKLRIAITGELKALIDRLTAASEGSVTCLHLIHDKGQPLTYGMLRKRFRKAATAAGQEFQFRDLRAKAATDIENLVAAQQLLGHGSSQMTEHYTRQRRGALVQPLSRIVETSTTFVEADSKKDAEAS